MRGKRISMRQGVARVADLTVHSTDGSSGTFGALIATTGCDVSLPLTFCWPASGARPGGLPVPLRSAAGCCGVYFVGFFKTPGGASIRTTDVQATWLAALVDGRPTLPD